MLLTSAIGMMLRIRTTRSQTGRCDQDHHRRDQGRRSSGASTARLQASATSTRWLPIRITFPSAITGRPSACRSCDAADRGDPLERRGEHVVEAGGSGSMKNRKTSAGQRPAEQVPAADGQGRRGDDQRDRRRLDALLVPLVEPVPQRQRAATSGRKPHQRWRIVDRSSSPAALPEDEQPRSGRRASRTSSSGPPTSGRGSVRLGVVRPGRRPRPVTAGRRGRRRPTPPGRPGPLPVAMACGSSTMRRPPRGRARPRPPGTGGRLA